MKKKQKTKEAILPALLLVMTMTIAMLLANTLEAAEKASL